MTSMTMQRWRDLRAAGRRLPEIVAFEGGHAIIARARPGISALALDADGYEYAVGCYLRSNDEQVEYFVDGKAVASRPRNGEWRRLTTPATTPHHHVDERAIKTRHGMDVAVALRRWVEQVRDWQRGRSDDVPSWMLLTGTTGAGKTSALRFVERELVALDVAVQFARWVDVVEAARENAAGKRQRFNARVVLLDDIAADNGSPFAAEVLYRVTDDAEQFGQCIAVSSNLDPAELLQHYRSGGDTENGNAARSVSRLQRRGRQILLASARKRA